MKVTKKQVGIGAVVVGLITAGVAAVKHFVKKPEEEFVCDGCDLYRCADETCELVEVNSPTCGWVPTEEFGRYQGVVYDRGTGEAIPSAAILVDSDLDSYSELNGNYRTGELTVGPHRFAVRSGMYETLVEDIEVELGLHNKDFAMQKKPPIAEFSIDWVRINHLLDHITVALGETLLVQAQIKSPTAVTPVCCYFNGVAVCQDVEYTTGGTAWPRFTYTPDAAGEVIVEFGSWTATVIVLADELGEWYSPFGCVPLEQAYWPSRNALIESLAWRPSLTGPPRDYRDCAMRIKIYGGYGKTNVRCPYCSAIMRATSQDWTALFNDLLNHIDQEHPHLPLNKPPAWLTWETGYVTKATVRYNGTHVPWLYWLYNCLPMPAGEVTVEIWYKDEKWQREQPPRYVEFNLTVEWGDRILCDLKTGEAAILKTWEELLSQP